MELLGSATYILLVAEIWFVPGFNFNQKVFFHVLILKGGKNTLLSPGSKLESYRYWITGSGDSRLCLTVTANLTGSPQRARHAVSH